MTSGGYVAGRQRSGAASVGVLKKLNGSDELVGRGIAVTYVRIYTPTCSGIAYRTDQAHSAHRQS